MNEVNKQTYFYRKKNAREAVILLNEASIHRI